MSYNSPDKKTVLISFILTIAGLVLLFFCILGTTRTALGQGGNLILIFDLVEILGFLGIGLIVIAWIYLFLGITSS
ncbi:MAG: hypothetical protein BAJALOKI1v1_1260004 [Promethearchaeota archaeon]|nr:MAG: hypothetical protein BAJALOKI1v1_1260004 [Candidatus Lokiarchaeota archaeon]